MSSSPSSPAAHFPSRPEEEFTSLGSGAPCSMQAEPRPQPHLTCIACHAMNELFITHWICSVTTKGQVSSQDLLGRMHLDNLAKVLCTRRLRWHGHVERNCGWLKKVQKLNSTGSRGPGLPQKRTEVIGMDCLALGLRLTLPIGKVEVVNLKVLPDWTHPLY